MEEEGLLSPGERRSMEGLAASLDAHFSQRFYTALAEAKVSLDALCCTHLPVPWNLTPACSISLVVAEAADSTPPPPPRRCTTRWIQTETRYQPTS